MQYILEDSQFNNDSVLLCKSMEALDITAFNLECTTATCNTPSRPICLGVQGVEYTTATPLVAATTVIPLAGNFGYVKNVPAAFETDPANDYMRIAVDGLFQIKLSGSFIYTLNTNPSNITMVLKMSNNAADIVRYQANLGEVPEDTLTSFEMIFMINVVGARRFLEIEVINDETVDDLAFRSLSLIVEKIAPPLP